MVVDCLRFGDHGTDVIELGDARCIDRDHGTDDLSSAVASSLIVEHRAADQPSTGGMQVGVQALACIT